MLTVKSQIRNKQDFTNTDVRRLHNYLHAASDNISSAINTISALIETNKDISLQDAVKQVASEIDAAYDFLGAYIPTIRGRT